MNLQNMSALLAALVAFVIGGSVILRDRKRRPYLTFTILCFNLCIWYLTSFFATTLKSEGLLWLSLTVALSIPINLEGFFRTFLAEDPRRPDPRNRVILLGTFICYLLLIYSGLVYPLHRHRWFTIPLWIFIFISLYYCVFLIYLRQRMIRPKPEATRLMYLFIGGIAAVTLSALDFLPKMGIIFPTFGNILTVIYLYFISQTLFHYRLLDIKELLGKMVTASALVFILTAFFNLLLSWVGITRPSVFIFNTSVASFVILVIFDQLRTRVENRVNKWMFREKYEFSRKLKLLRQEMANIIEVPHLVTRFLRTLEESERVTHASIHLADSSGSNFRLTGHFGPLPIEQIESTTKRIFLERLKESGLITREALERDLGAQIADGQEDAAVVTRLIMSTMEELYASVCIPLTLDNQILGILNLQDERLREAYASDELNELRQIAAQAAITLRNSKVYEQMKERDRLAALGQMAAGLAHEIRNPLGAIKGAAQLLKSSLAEDSHPAPFASDEDLSASMNHLSKTQLPDENQAENKTHVTHSAELSATHEEQAINKTLVAHSAEPFSLANAIFPNLPHDSEALLEFREYVEIIVEEVDRLDRVVSQFLGYARPDRGERELLNINDVVYKTIQLLRSQAGSIEIKTQLASNLPLVRADSEQLRQVFLNLGINGLQAMENGGMLKVETRLKKDHKRGKSISFVEISFHDSGGGIPQESLSNIFIPFFTTKDHGTGLGLPICQRIIENHKGSIEVRSQPGQGSIFSVLLPSDLDQTSPQAVLKNEETKIAVSEKDKVLAARSARDRQTRQLEEGELSSEEHDR